MSEKNIKKKQFTAVKAKFAAVSPFSKKATQATLLCSCKKTGILPVSYVDFAIMFEDENKPLFLTSSQYKQILRSSDKTEAAHRVIYSILVDNLKKTVGGKEWINDYKYKTADFFDEASGNTAALA